MSSHVDEIWKPCLEFLKQRVNKQTYFTWLNPTYGVQTSNGTFLIGTPNRFVADWLSEHLSGMIRQALQEITGKDWKLEFTVNGSSEKKGSPPTVNMISIGDGAAIPDNGKYSGATYTLQQPPITTRRSPWRDLFNPKHNFDSFVVGESNEFAHGAAVAVAECPGLTSYNPLFIYGGTGLGKTHLVQAIGQFILDTNPQARVLYATSEQFTNDFINALSSQTIADFTRTYRKLDCLLLDDIQFFTGKESTQVQFFHTFNTLHQMGKQIVLTSDRPPREIKGLQDRLLSRFHSGLVTDIQPPDFETRLAILKKKLEAEHYAIPDDVLSYVAQRITSNIRELEGALIRLLAIRSLKNIPVDLALAEEVLKDQLSPNRKPISARLILQRVAAAFEVSPDLILSKRKTAEVALARQAAMYLARTLTNLSLKAIGAEFGGRDHSTVIHAVNLIRNTMQKDADLKYRIDSLITELYGGTS